MLEQNSAIGGEANFAIFLASAPLVIAVFLGQAYRILVADY